MYSNIHFGVLIIKILKPFYQLYVIFFDRKENDEKKLSALELHSLNNCTVRPKTVKLAYAQTMTVLPMSHLHCLLIPLGADPKPNGVNNHC